MQTYPRNRATQADAQQFTQNTAPQVVKMAESMKASLPKTEADIAPLEALVRAAYKSIDMAVTKGIFHANNGDRKKARCAKYKRELLIAAGLYTPAPNSPGYDFAQRLQQKAASQAAAAAAAH